MQAVNKALDVFRRVLPRGRARSVITFCVIPAIVVVGLILAAVTITPAPSAAGTQRLTSADMAAAGLGQAMPKTPAVVTAAGTLQISDLKVRAADDESALAAAQAIRDHKLHLAHLAHLRYLAAKAAAPQYATPRTTTDVTGASAAGTSAPGFYTEAMLGELWISEGGSAAAESVAVCIAEHESGGNPGAVSPTDDYGLWQINASNALPSLMLNPYANAREAISLSDDGSNWSPWTTERYCVAADTADVTPSGDSITAYALSFKGYPYVYGGTSPSGFDCSGFAQYVYAHFGKSIPRTSEEQAAYLTSTSDPSPGDLVFFWSGGDAFHVGIFLGGGEMISALNSSYGVIVTPVSWGGPDYSFGTLA